MEKIFMIRYKIVVPYATKNTTLMYKYYNWKLYRLQPGEAMGRYISHEKYDNLKDFAEDVAKEPLEYEPGTQFVYGISQAILGRIVEVVTKKTFYERV